MLKVPLVPRHFGGKIFCVLGDSFRGGVGGVGGGGESKT